MNTTKTNRANLLGLGLLVASAVAAGAAALLDHLGIRVPGAVQTVLALLALAGIPVAIGWAIGMWGHRGGRHG